MLYLDIWFGQYLFQLLTVNNCCIFFLFLTFNKGLKQQIWVLSLQSLVWYGGIAGGFAWLFGNRSKGPSPGSAWILLICCLIFPSFSLSPKLLFLQSHRRPSHSLHGPCVLSGVQARRRPEWVSCSRFLASRFVIKILNADHQLDGSQLDFGLRWKYYCKSERGWILMVWSEGRPDT